MKNLKYKNLVIGFIPIFLLALGCSDDFLEQEIQGAVPAEDLYGSETGAIQATTAIYDVMSASYNTSWNSSMYLLKTLPSDESNAGGAGPGDQPPYQAIDDFTFGPENEVVIANWRLAYNAIFNANRVINFVEPDNALKKRLVAEAKALRAYNYLDLVSLWGDVPIVLEDILPEEWNNFHRRPTTEVYAQIEKDLTESILDLPIKNDYDAGDKFRISKGAAQAILGKAYLYQEKWDKAAAVLQEVIDDPSYDLEPSIAAVFAKEGEFGKESLFELSHDSKQAYTWGNFPWDWRPESNIIVQLMGPREQLYKPIPGDSLVEGWGVNTPTQKMWDAFIAAGEQGSERKQATIMSEAELKALGGDFTDPTLHDYEGFIRRKYGTYTTETGSAGDAPLNMGTNWRLIRYADVLLMAAEANFRDGEPGLALDYINEVRRRSNVPEILGALTFEDIVRERQLELAFEGFRYIDLIRWSLAAQELGSRGFKTGKHELLPIPIVDVRSYGLEQNNY